MKLYTKGSRVTQGTYGSGTVTSSDEKYTVIEFDDHASGGGTAASDAPTK